jgi:hypothetical protein
MVAPNSGAALASTQGPHLNSLSNLGSLPFSTEEDSRIQMSSRPAQREPAMTGLPSQTILELELPHPQLSPSKSSPHETFRKLRAGHRRSSSGGGLIESTGHNRWSQSSVSSTNSNRKRNSINSLSPTTSNVATATASNLSNFTGFVASNRTHNRPTPLTLGSLRHPPPHPPHTIPPALASPLSPHYQHQQQNGAIPTSSREQQQLGHGSHAASGWGHTGRGVTATNLNQAGTRSTANAQRSPHTPLFGGAMLNPDSASAMSSEGNTKSLSPESDMLSPSDQKLGKEKRPMGHTRGREGNSKGSMGGSAKSDRQPSQKAMLSSALQKAHTAVLLDNAQNFEGAVDAYGDACALLEQVMLRSNGDEDRRKLQAIRETYNKRIQELRNLSPQFRGEKALPARPESNSDMQSPLYDETDDEHADLEHKKRLHDESDDDDPELIMEAATNQRINNDQSYLTGLGDARRLAPVQVPPRRESLMPNTFAEQTYLTVSAPTRNETSLRSPIGEFFHGNKPHIYQPAPDHNGMPDGYGVAGRKGSLVAAAAVMTGDDNLPLTLASSQQLPLEKNDPQAWLKSVEESERSSSAGSLQSRSRSRSSSFRFGRQRPKLSRHNTEEEFDAALDAAVEAAYADEIPEPELLPSMRPPALEFTSTMSARTKVELAKERVREAEREAAIQLAKEREKRRLQQTRLLHQTRKASLDTEYNDEEAEEEERLLEEMNKEYLLNEFDFGTQVKAPIPRGSDSSSFSRSTEGSSGTSASLVATMTLSPVSENVKQRSPNTTSPLHAPPNVPPPHAPPSVPLPRPPISVTSPSPHPLPSMAPPFPPPTHVNGPSGLAPQSQTTGIRSRRTSLQGKPLTIETSKPALLSSPPKTQPSALTSDPVTDIPSPPKSTNTISSRKPSIAMPPIPGNLQTTAPKQLASPVSAVSASRRQFLSDADSPVPRSPVKAGPNLRHVYSASSLKHRNMAAAEASDGSPITPGIISTPNGGTFSSSTSIGPRKDSIATPALPQFASHPSILGNYLFDHTIHQPDAPGTPNPFTINPPASLEACPAEHNLRPFWLMRCLYETIAHPKGGYLTASLFIPHGIWFVKNVKLKNIEDKVANCKLVTIALRKLATVDADDADAVLEEMQNMESVLDKAQLSLSKKLGNEVGAAGTSALFKDATVGVDLNSGEAIAQKANHPSTRSYLSWGKKLRVKSSGGTTATSHTKESKDMYSIASLPMTHSPVKSVKRDIDQVQAGGPHASYMLALANLFDAAQVLDQVARQVEDPGLKHSSQTQVGLEFSTRHVSEFFAFYICRFVLSDIAMLLDKFVKRGSEWVNV